MSEAMNPAGTKPPAGEAGLCRIDECSSLPGWQYWAGRHYNCFSEIAERAARYANDGDQSAHQNLPWRWATLSELLAVGLSEAEALPMLHHSQRPKGDGWIAHKPGDPCPTGLVLEIRYNDGDRQDFGDGAAAHMISGWGWLIVAYRLLKPAAETELERAVRRLAAIPMPEEPDANADMVQRDLRPPTQREFGYAIRRMLAPDEQEEPAEAPELLIVAPIGQRVGSGWWGVRP